ncbi:MAG: LysR family transcriptional regulator [Glutamicibacter sp.]
MVTLRQFEYFAGIVDEGSFTRAAVALHVTQPALSHQVAALEREIGAPLLERFPRTVGLTATGRAVLPHVRAALASSARAKMVALKASGAIGGELRVATVHSMTLGILPGIMRGWTDKYAGLNVRLFEHRHTDELREAMISGEADLAVGPRPANWLGPVSHLKNEDFVVLLAASDPLVSPLAMELDLVELSERRWVHYAPDNGLADVVDLACHRAGFRPQIAVRTEQTASAISLAAAGLGPALVPADIVPASFDGRVLFPSPRISRELVVYARDLFDPLVAAVVANTVAKCPARA